jgi:hypothetical protein
MSAPETGQFQAYTVREPVGVAALVVAWNLPIALTVCKLHVRIAEIASGFCESHALAAQRGERAPFGDEILQPHADLVIERHPAIAIWHVYEMI